MTKIVFIRHAESEYNRDGIWAGRADCNLTEKGIETAKELGKSLNNNFDVIYCSPLKRARQTLSAIFPEAEPIYDERITEISYVRENRNLVKAEYLDKNAIEDKIIFLIDDDIEVLKGVQKLPKENIIPVHVTSILI